MIKYNVKGAVMKNKATAEAKKKPKKREGKMKVTKTAILKELNLDNTWNRIHECFGLKVATVLWHTGNAWKVVTTDDFDKITDYKDKTYIVAEFYDQKELCNYIYQRINQSCNCNEPKKQVINGLTYNDCSKCGEPISTIGGEVK